MRPHCCWARPTTTGRTKWQFRTGSNRAAGATTDGGGGTASDTCRPAALAFADLAPYQCASTHSRIHVVSSLTLRIALVALGLALVGSRADAQRRMRGGRAVSVARPGVGARFGYDFDAQHTFLGGQFDFPVGRRWALAPS